MNYIHLKGPSTILTARTDMCRLTTGIRSQKWVVRQFHHCTNVC